MEMNEIYLKAYGKINLALDVLRRREDGYHEVRMIMQTVDIFDSINIMKTDSGEIEIETNLFYLPVNENNIVYKAAKLLFDEFGIRSGLKIKLKKFMAALPSFRYQRVWQAGARMPPALCLELIKCLIYNYRKAS